MGVHARGGGEFDMTSYTVFIQPQLYQFLELRNRVQHKINLNPSVHSIRSLPAKLAIPSNPHLFIIALSCAFEISRSPRSTSCMRSYLIPRGTFALQSVLLRSHSIINRKLTGRRQHLFSSEHRICPRHKTHHLFRLTQILPSSRQADNRPRKHDASSRDRSKHCRKRYRLLNPISTVNQAGG